MTRSVPTLSAIVIALCVTACSGDGLEALSVAQCIDEGGIPDELSDGGVTCNFGEAGAADDFGDAGPPPDPGADSGDESLDAASYPECDDLVVATCGTEGGPVCPAAPACEAAQLLSRHEPERCAEAIDDDTRYPDCQESPCDELVNKVCFDAAGERTCESSPGCGPATTLRDEAAEAQGSDLEDALEECEAALEDNTLFSRCQ